MFAMNDEVETPFKEEATKRVIHLPIAVDQLAGVVENLKRDENRAFSLEYSVRLC